MAWSKPRFRPIRACVIYMLFYNYFSRVLCKYIQNSRTSQGFIYFPHFILQHFATKPFNFTHFEMSFPGCLFPIVSNSLPIIDRCTVVGCYAFCSRNRGLRFFQRCWCECEMASCYFIIEKVMYLALDFLLLEQFFGYILTGLYTSIFKRNYGDNFI
jgi:hypothetical protein